MAEPAEPKGLKAGAQCEGAEQKAESRAGSGAQRVGEGAATGKHRVELRSHEQERERNGVKSLAAAGEEEETDEPGPLLSPISRPRGHTEGQTHRGQV